MFEELAEKIRITEKSAIAAFASMAPVVKDMVERMNNSFAIPPANNACSRRVPRRGAKVVKSKSRVSVGRTRG